MNLNKLLINDGKCHLPNNTRDMCVRLHFFKMALNNSLILEFTLFNNA